MIFLAIVGLFALLVVAHELGHLITAKLSGVVAEEFGLGFPPRLLSWRWRGTLYSLNLLPLGGFVRLRGEEDPTLPGSLAGKSLKARALVLSSGSLMNILLPLFLLAASYMLPRTITGGDIVIQEVRPGSPAQGAGLLPGDRVVEVNGLRVLNSADLLYQVVLHLGQEVELRVERGGEGRQVRLVPRWRPPSEEGAMGVELTMVNLHPVRVSSPPWQAFPRAARSLTETFILIRNEVVTWLVGAQRPQVGGPVAIVQIAGEAARAGPSPLLRFAAFLSINLAIINLLPIPGLDGGRLLFVALEAVRRGRRVSPRLERLIHLVGFMVLMALILFISYYDLQRAFSGQELLP